MRLDDPIPAAERLGNKGEGGYGNPGVLSLSWLAGCRLSVVGLAMSAVPRNRDGFILNECRGSSPGGVGGGSTASIPPVDGAAPDGGRVWDGRRGEGGDTGAVSGGARSVPPR